MPVIREFEVVFQLGMARMFITLEGISASDAFEASNLAYNLLDDIVRNADSWTLVKVSD
jgi:hypothetical protein